MTTIKQVYDLAISLGIKNDLRGSSFVANKLKYKNEKYNKLDKEEKLEFDKEILTNPYADSRVLTNGLNKKVSRVMVGIDIDTSEILLAHELSKDKKIDLVIGHHPLGVALAGLGDVMDLQIELLHKYGIPINIAEDITKLRMNEVSRGINPINHNKVVDAAKLLNIELMNIHTPADNMVATFLDNLIKKNEKKLERVEDLLKLLKEIPEYREAIKTKVGPKLFVGSPDRYLGKIAVTEITGGTSGSKDYYEKIANAGIGTIVGMHMGEEHRKEAEKAHLNIVIAGHMSSDSIGMNLFCDELEKKDIEIIPCSGFIRYSRVKK
ncbi:MAG: NGG1p interacting factor NIF3 [Patescibacteria group bacterium]|nr:NGG1p interacting factor NIF3 [Patescibacteria group bacterium]MDD4304735.1 NGG1p interacting factor NIF3 [Patescibacteria group bacterium]MDD4695510.1 NGG1p interacting factor NIF3 [Patescibacteria group bacterium]